MPYVPGPSVKIIRNVGQIVKKNQVKSTRFSKIRPWAIIFEITLFSPNKFAAKGCQGMLHWVLERLVLH